MGKLSQRQLAAVLDYVSSNLRADSALADLANVAGPNRYHFARALKRTIGQSPYSFILSQRTREAANLLSSSGLPVETVAASVGFQPPSQFRRAFRQILGTSPQGFPASSAPNHFIRTSAALTVPLIHQRDTRSPTSGGNGE